jgi:hypothetical protein
MHKHNYFVSVFVHGRHVNSYFSEDLDDLVTIKVMNGPDCELSIFDISRFVLLTAEQVEIEIVKSRNRWKKSLEKHIEEPPEEPIEEEVEEKPKKSYVWKRPVLCVETGQVFKSIRECSDKVGIPYMTITNCIKNKNATRGVHFIQLEEDETE